MSAAYTDDDVQAAMDSLADWTAGWSRVEMNQVRRQIHVVLDAVAPAIAARAKAEAWDGAADATADWMWNNPTPSGIPVDPPRNPYADEIERTH